MTDPEALAKAVEQAEGPDNALDVLIECALFVPDAEFLAIRPNDAGTKVICTRADGRETTHWADDWTMNRPACAAALRAHIERTG